MVSNVAERSSKVRTETIPLSEATRRSLRYEGELFLYYYQSGMQTEKRSRDDFGLDVQSAAKGQFSPGREGWTPDGRF